MKQPLNCLTKTLDELKRLTPDSHDSLTLSRRRKSLSIQRKIQSVRSMIKTLLGKKIKEAKAKSNVSMV